MLIEWTEPALADLKGIRDYITPDSPYYADRFVERIFDAAEKLDSFPERGRRVPEADRDDIRELIFQSYRIIYRLAPDKVVVLTIIHGGRDLEGQAPKPWEVT